MSKFEPVTITDICGDEIRIELRDDEVFVSIEMEETKCSVILPVSDTGTLIAALTDAVAAIAALGDRS